MTRTSADDNDMMIDLDRLVAWSVDEVLRQLKSLDELNPQAGGVARRRLQRELSRIEGGQQPQTAADPTAGDPMLWVDLRRLLMSRRVERPEADGIIGRIKRLLGIAPEAVTPSPPLSSATPGLSDTAAGEGGQRAAA